jgi:hypothetical protein
LRIKHWDKSNDLQNDSDCTPGFEKVILKIKSMLALLDSCQMKGIIPVEVGKVKWQVCNS